jgi:hypothetical protein
LEGHFCPPKEWYHCTRKRPRIVKQILPITQHNARDSMKSLTFEKLVYECETVAQHDYLGLSYFRERERDLTPQQYVQ